MPTKAGEERERYATAIRFTGYWTTSGEELEGCPKVQLLMALLPGQVCAMYHDEENQPLLTAGDTMFNRLWAIM